MLNPLNYSTKDNYERAVAELAEHDAIEARQRKEHDDFEAANAASAARAREELPVTSKFDWLGLAALDQHPQLVKATADVAAAKQRHATAHTNAEQARADLHAAEEAAARGRHDDAALTRAYARIQQHASELRIAAKGVELAEQNHAAILRAVTFAASENLRNLHKAAIGSLLAALTEAQKYSQLAAAIEDKNRLLLFRTEDYSARSRKLARPITPIAWRREFAPGGFFDFWRKHHRLTS